MDSGPDMQEYVFGLLLFVAVGTFALVGFVTTVVYLASRSMPRTPRIIFPAVAVARVVLDLEGTALFQRGDFPAPAIVLRGNGFEGSIDVDSEGVAMVRVRPATGKVKEADLDARIAVGSTDVKSGACVILLPEGIPTPMG